MLLGCGSKIRSPEAWVEKRKAEGKAWVEERKAGGRGGTIRSTP